jgi:uncharacterized protein YbbC (DUF1343 family)
MTGLERFLQNPFALRDAGAAALFTNPTGVTRDLEPGAVALRRVGVRLEVLLAPEHGIDGSGREGEAPERAVDAASGVPVVTLYDKKPDEIREVVRSFDTVIYDIQGVGTRFYTYLTSLQRLLEACRSENVRLVVLDRPNPNGFRLEGALMRQEFSSFVGVTGIPLRHGCTFGELARIFAAGWDGLQVIECDPLEAVTPWIAPSPNLPNLETALIYPGTCLVEGTALSEGRGTTLPFQVFGAPGLDAPRLAARLNETGLNGVRFRAAYFTPTGSKHAGTLCAGAQAHVVGTLDRVLPIGLSIVAAVAEQGAALNLEWLRKLLGVGVGMEDLVFENVETLCQTWELEARDWLEANRASLLYAREFPADAL